MDRMSMEARVPGHGRFVKSFVGGAGFLLLIALPVAGRQAASGALSQPATAVSPNVPTHPPPSWRGTMDEERARQLYVSNDASDHPKADYETHIRDRTRTEARFAAASAGVLDYRKIEYRSSVGDLDIPAYLFQPLERRGPRGHAALVWVHGGVHSNLSETMFPFIREAVDRGYVVIAPEYRGSTGYGEAHYQAIDYGGYEIDDVMTAVEYLGALPHVDRERLAIIGWSHGGYISLFTVFRQSTPFKAAAAIVPVANLLFRLSLKGPSYQRSFATQKRIGGLPFEKPELYIERSPLYSVDKLRTPLLVHVATNDTDVNFVESQQLVDALRARKPDLAETKIYVNPPPGPAGGGHTFSRRVNPKTLEREDTPAQHDSWSRTWAFLEGHLRPYEGAPPKVGALRSSTDAPNNGMKEDPKQIRVEGQLTDEGVECPALKGDDGKLYTLTSRDLKGFKAGDRVVVEGKVAEMSFCMQGTTIQVTSIRKASK